jgi:heme-degrading monooxygenase HmoA
VSTATPIDAGDGPGYVGPMTVKHIVLWKLKEIANDAPKEANARAVTQKLEALRGRIPGMRHIEVGIDIERSASAYDVALYSEFESRDALAAYQDHPEHKAIMGFIMSVRDARVVVDYES